MEGPWVEPRGFERVAVVAQFSSTPQLSRSFEQLVKELTAHGYLVIVSSTTEGTPELQWQGGRPANVSVLRRPNVGYDFGSWAVVLNSFAGVRSAKYLLTLNDSLVGPFSSIAPLLENFESAPGPVWGAVRSYQFAPHLQSYFLGYHDGVVASGPLRKFWNRISVQGTKTDVIWKYELGLSELLRTAGIHNSAAFDGAAIVEGETNPSILGWRRLLESRFPFVKRQLLVEPGVAPDSHEIAAVIRNQFGEEVTEWL